MNTIRTGMIAAVAAAVPAAALAQAAPSNTKSSEPACPCADYGFTPLNAKARAVAEYWEARRAYKIAGGLNATVALFALMARDGRTAAAARQSYDDEFAKMISARERAESLGGLTVKPGEDVDHDVVTITLVKGQDYELEAVLSASRRARAVA